MTYQHQVNSLTGSLGPTTVANWNSTTTTTGAPYSLGAQPLYFSPSLGKYVTSYDNMSTVDFSSFGRSRSKKRRCSNKSVSKKHLKKRHCKSKHTKKSSKRRCPKVHCKVRHCRSKSRSRKPRSRRSRSRRS